MKVLTTIVLAAVLLVSRPVFAQEEGSSSSNTNMEILLEKVKTDKKLLVAANMDLTDAEAKKFWPLYEAYQKELQKQNERLGKAIMEYADAYNKGPIPNDKAKKLMKEVLSISHPVSHNSHPVSHFSHLVSRPLFTSSFSAALLAAALLKLLQHLVATSA